MKIIAIGTLIILMATSFAAAQTPGFHVIFGDRDGSAIDVNIDDLIELQVWVATPSFFDLNGDTIQDTIRNVFIPLGGDDSAIFSWEGGIVYHPFINWDHGFYSSVHCQAGYLNQSMFAFPPSFGWWSPLITYEDTIHALSFFLRTSQDSSLLGSTVCPFIAGCDPVNGYLLWALQDGITEVIPSQTYSCLYFVDYLAGDANGSGFVNGYDVTYLVAYLKGYAPPPDPLLSGDANGDCDVNGSDITYIINYCKGGPAPILGNCH